MLYPSKLQEKGKNRDLHMLFFVFPFYIYFPVEYYHFLISLRISIIFHSFRRSTIDLYQFPLLDKRNYSDPFSFSQKHYQLIWNSDIRKFSKYSINSRQLNEDVCLFFHTEYYLIIFFILSLNRFHRIYHIQRNWKGYR